MKLRLVTSFLAAAMLLAIPAAAHHSMAGFERTKTVEVKGVIKQFKWANPHSWIELEATDDAGKPVLWNFEMTAPAYLARAGWKSTTLKAGDKVTISGRPLLSGDPGALFVSVTLEDGRVLSERAQGAGKGKAK